MSKAAVLRILLGLTILLSASLLRAQRGGGSRTRSSQPDPSDAGRGPLSANLPPVTYEGVVSALSDEAIVLKFPEGRLFSIKRSSGTKFYKDSQEIKATDLHTGDNVSVVARQDNHGFLIASKVTYSDAPPEPPPTAPGTKVQPPDAGLSASSDAAPDSPSSSDHPVLKRAGQPSSEAPEESDKPTGYRDTTASRPSADSMRPSDDGDPLIEKAREAALAFSDTLPNFLCNENVARYDRDPHGLGWRSLDVVSAEVIYEDGKESYRNLLVNSRPTDKPMEQLSGSWSTGEFATTLTNLFHADTRTEFRYGEPSKMLGLPAQVYDFEVKKENSHWNVSSGDRSVIAAYKGSVWIEPDSGRVLRIEIQATGLPSDFPLDQVESAVDYSFVQIGTQSVLLPSHAESLGCQRHSSACDRNVIDFRNYRKYTTDSRVKF